MSKSCLILPDVHIPFEDKRAYELCLMVSESIKNLSEIILLGDFCDFYNVSFFGKNLGIGVFLKDEQDAALLRLRELRNAFKKCTIIFIEGNHENRLMRYIQEKATAFFGMIDLKEFLKLKELNIDLVEYQPNQKHAVLGSKLLARHEGIANGMYSAHQSVLKASTSIIFGHTHRIQESQIVSLDNSILRGINTGCLCDFYNPDAPFQYVKGHFQWSHAFSVVTISDGLWFNQLIPILKKGDKYYCFYNGNIFIN